MCHNKGNWMLLLLIFYLRIYNLNIINIITILKGISFMLNWCSNLFKNHEKNQEEVKNYLTKLVKTSCCDFKTL